MSYNLSELPERDRLMIELDRQASLLIYRLKKNKITRYQVVREIDNKPESQREDFRRLVNIYKERK